MASVSDPSRRLDPLRRSSQATIPEEGQEPAGWVPEWTGADAGTKQSVNSGRHAEQSDHRDEDVADDPEPFRARSILQPGLRWRNRWVPESIQESRVDPGQRGTILLMLIAAVVALGVALVVCLRSDEPVSVLPASIGTPVTAAESAAPSAASATPTSTATIVVSVTGSVRAPGIVELPAGARVADALGAAGGVLDGVDITGLNLAAKLADGDSVVVGGSHAGLHGVTASPATPGLVNLNTADQATLETLPGVGPVMAANILAFRSTNGSFDSIDQLQEIAGIGPVRFATLSALVMV